MLDQPGLGEVCHAELEDGRDDGSARIASATQDIGTGTYTILALLASEKLGLSVKTVSTYRTRALDKMKLTTNAELTQYAIRHNLIQ